MIWLTKRLSCDKAEDHSLKTSHKVGSALYGARALGSVNKHVMKGYSAHPSDKPNLDCEKVVITSQISLAKLPYLALISELLSVI